MAPSFRGRTPVEIMTENVTFDSAGYVYRGLSWLDYAKRCTSVCALQYAALETRQAIEQLLFEEVVISVGGRLARDEYERCKGNGTKLAKVVRRLSPDYDKLISFLQTIMSLDANAPKLITWDHSALLKHWGSASNYIHWAGEPNETSESPQWFVRGVGDVERAAMYMWDNMKAGDSGILIPSQMQPEIRQAWEAFKSGEIDADGVRSRANLALPALRLRQETFRPRDGRSGS